MRIFILLLTTIILSSFSIAQKDTDLNERVESYIAHSNLNMSRLEKLEAIRTNTSLDSLKREKKWQKAYEKWDPSNETANFPIAGSILSSIGPEKWRYTATLPYPDFSNEFLAWLVDMRITQGNRLTEQAQMFIRNVLKRRKDVSEELITKECEKIFVEANRFGKDTPILPAHFDVMASYIRATHPEAKGFAEFADLLRRYESKDIEKLIAHTEKSELSLNQLNTIPSLRHYSTELSIGRLFRDDLLRCHELYRHSHGGRIYLTPELWDRYKFTMYEQFFNNKKIGNML